ncbi:MAG: glycosyltransferase family 2 protein [Candidatus Magasanikbacteria bacterium]|nr:glycosyltransferase family 2 protein [Candidatus Magasanikbacteria bacterium]
MNNKKPTISIIIPTYNEEKIINKTLDQFKSIPKEIEVILVDGKSNDDTIKIAKQYTNITILQSQKKGRAAQMNYGSNQAKGDILLFLHADSILPKKYLQEIKNAIQQKNIIGGAFKITFPINLLAYKLINLYSNVRAKIFKIYHGDQAIFITKKIFNNIGTYPDVPLMEDVLLSEKMKKTGATILLPFPVTTSERRIKKTGITKSIILYFLIKSLHKLHVSPHTLAHIYKKTAQ